jgi:hypothetical protein
MQQEQELQLWCLHIAKHCYVCGSRRVNADAFFCALLQELCRTLVS